MKPMYYKPDGTLFDDPNPTLAWAKDLESPERFVKQEVLENGKFVSTVWLGLDHNYGEGEPLIFETMVFASKNDRGDLDMNRYSTKEEALAFVKSRQKWDKSDNRPPAG